jgi:hypothetical protein
MIRARLTLLMAVALILSATTSLAQRTVKTADFSGWMSNYETLTYDEERNAFIFENEVKRGAYDSIILESVVLHGVGAEKNPEIADEAIRYLEKGIREMLARKAMGADKPGPGVLRMTVAITGVRKSKEGLKPQHVLPVAAVFRGAQEVSGNVGTYIDTRFEGEIVDSVSGERVVAIVAKGIEDTSKRSGDVLDFEDVQPTLDRWLGQLEENLERNLAAR